MLKRRSIAVRRATATSSSRRARASYCAALLVAPGGDARLFQPLAILGSAPRCTSRRPAASAARTPPGARAIPAPGAPPPRARPSRAPSASAAKRAWRSAASFARRASRSASSFASGAGARPLRLARRAWRSASSRGEPLALRRRAALALGGLAAFALRRRLPLALDPLLAPAAGARVRPPRGAPLGGLAAFALAPPACCSRCRRSCSSRRRSCSARQAASWRRRFSCLGGRLPASVLLFGGGLAAAVLSSSAAAARRRASSSARAWAAARARSRAIGSAPRALQRPEQPDAKRARLLVLLGPDGRLPRALLGLDVDQADQLQKHLRARRILRRGIGRQRQRAPARRRRAELDGAAHDAGAHVAGRQAGRRAAASRAASAAAAPGLICAVAVAEPPGPAAPALACTGGATAPTSEPIRFACCLPLALQLREPSGAVAVERLADRPFTLRARARDLIMQLHGVRQRHHVAQHLRAVALGHRDLRHHRRPRAGRARDRRRLPDRAASEIAARSRREQPRPPTPRTLLRW